MPYNRVVLLPSNSCYRPSYLQELLRDQPGPMLRPCISLLVLLVFIFCVEKCSDTCAVWDVMCHIIISENHIKVGYLDFWDPIILSFPYAQHQLTSTRSACAPLMNNWAPSNAAPTNHPQKGAKPALQWTYGISKQKEARLTDTHFPAFIKSRAALGFTSVHRFFTMSVGSTVTDSKEKNEWLIHIFHGSETKSFICLHIF